VNTLLHGTSQHSNNKHSQVLRSEDNQALTAAIMGDPVAQGSSEEEFMDSLGVERQIFKSEMGACHQFE
jgi:hypothetical protein